MAIAIVDHRACGGAAV